MGDHYEVKKTVEHNVRSKDYFAGRERRKFRRRIGDAMDGATRKLTDCNRCGEAHSDALPTILDLAGGNNPAFASRALIGLQRHYGNHFVQRVVDLQGKETRDSSVSSEVEQAIQSKRGTGQPLDKATRVQMKNTFDFDFSGVRIHKDDEADTLNRSLSARAFTTGQDIFFKQGAYNTDSSSGKELLAHELTHVVQQTGETRAKLSLGHKGDRYEQEADRVAKAVVKREQGVFRKDPGQERVQPQVEEEEEEALQMQEEEVSQQTKKSGV